MKMYSLFSQHPFQSGDNIVRSRSELSASFLLKIHKRIPGLEGTGHRLGHAMSVCVLAHIHRTRTHFCHIESLALCMASWARRTKRKSAPG